MWIFIVALALLIPILAIVLDSDFGKAIARRLDRKNLKQGEGAVQDRLARLEGELERLGGEVVRLDEESQFFQRLLTERAEARELGAADPNGTADADADA